MTSRSGPFGHDTEALRTMERPAAKTIFATHEAEVALPRDAIRFVTAQTEYRTGSPVCCNLHEGQTTNQWEKS